MKQIAYLLLIAAAGCAQQTTEPSRPTVEVSVVDKTGRIVFPAKVERPAKLNWSPATNGLELATWVMSEWPFVFCAVRNPTKEPVKYPGGCGLGWWEFTSVLVRQRNTTNWTEIKIRPVTALGPRVVTGAGPISMVLKPGQEVRTSGSRLGGSPVSLVDRGFSFHIDLTEYDLPEELSGPIEIRIESLGYRFPVSTLPIEMTRRANQAIDSDKK